MIYQDGKFNDQEILTDKAEEAKNHIFDLLDKGYNVLQQILYPEKDHKKILVSGEYGTGKTSLCRIFEKKHPKRFISLNDITDCIGLEERSYPQLLVVIPNGNKFFSDKASREKLSEILEKTKSQIILVIFCLYPPYAIQNDLTLFEKFSLEEMSSEESYDFTKRYATSVNYSRELDLLTSNKEKYMKIFEIIGGNPRRLLNFLELWHNNESLSEVLIGVLDHQIPYLEKRLEHFSQLKQSILRLMSSSCEATTAKSIAFHLGTTNQTISSQLKKLRTLGFVEYRDDKRMGRERHYDVKDILVRMYYRNAQECRDFFEALTSSLFSRKKMFLENSNNPVINKIRATMETEDKKAQYKLSKEEKILFDIVSIT